jgi:hypothetical protein
MFKVGEIVDQRFKVDTVCESPGGMGTILFVYDENTPESGVRTKFALKYCNFNNPTLTERFKREVHLMESFSDNAHVARIVHANLEFHPPYYVMEYYVRGDLTSLIPDIRKDDYLAERYFNQMIDCIDEFHTRGVFHRDIKPQNFLVGEKNLVVTDFGLSTANENTTDLTVTFGCWGTKGYIPPEFLEANGFKNANAQSDIYMLGVTFRNILFGEGVPQRSNTLKYKPLESLIDKACAVNPNDRFKSLAELNHSLTIAFDSIHEPVYGSNSVLDAAKTITEKWNNGVKAIVVITMDFLDDFLRLNTTDKIQVCLHLPSDFFNAIASTGITEYRIQNFLQCYMNMATQAEYKSRFAEVVAINMSYLFYSKRHSPVVKAEALSAAIAAAERKDRKMAMATCEAMITSVFDPVLSQKVIEVMEKHKASFIRDIDPFNCKSNSIANFLDSCSEECLG